MVTNQKTPLFRHEALPYSSLDALLDQVTAFLGPAMDQGDPVMISVESGKIPHFEQAFGKRFPLSPMEEVGRNPGRLISLWQDFLEENGATDKTVWGIGEPIYSGRRPAELIESQIHERLLNQAFIASPFALRLGCPYDAGSLPADVIQEMGRSHPFIGAGEDSRDSEDFRSANGWASDPPLSPALITDEAFVSFDKTSLGEMRKRLAGVARGCGVDESRIPDLVLAVNEIATNSIVYAGSGSLGVWQEDSRIVCEVRDKGIIEDALVGRRRPAITEHRGRGIWFANQVADLLQLRSTPSGTRCRVTFDCAPPS